MALLHRDCPHAGYLMSMADNPRQDARSALAEDQGATPEPWAR